MIFCFEGPNGVGKGTVSEKVFAELKKRGIDYKVVCDKTDKGFRSACASIRSGEVTLADGVELTARARGNFHTYIRTTIHEREMIFLDRCYYTSAVLQSQSWNDIERIVLRNKECGSFIPKRTFILVAPPEVILSRIHARGKYPDETSTLKNVESVLEKYQRIAEEYDECLVLDATKHPLENARIVLEEVAL